MRLPSVDEVQTTSEINNIDVEPDTPVTFNLQSEYIDDDLITLGSGREGSRSDMRFHCLAALRIAFVTRQRSLVETASDFGPGPFALNTWR